MWRAVASNGITLLIVGIFLVGGLVLWGQRTYREAGPLDEAICLRVPGGSSMGAVSRDLESQDAIADARVFRIGADYSEKSGQLKAGSFLVPPGASMEQIVDIVTRGGASTCGTEVVYRIGVTRSLVDVRQIDPTENRFVDVAEFNPATDEVPEAYTRVVQEPDTRYRVAVAEGVTSWQIIDTREW